MFCGIFVSSRLARQCEFLCSDLLGVNLPPRLKRGQTMELDPLQVRQILKWAGIEAPAIADKQTRPDEEKRVSRIRSHPPVAPSVATEKPARRPRKSSMPR